MSAPLTLDCPGKVNLALSIGSPLENGFHPLASWMVAVRFGDRLTLERSPQTDAPSRFDLAFDADAPVASSAKVDWPLEKDLAFRAHQLLECETGRKLPVKLTLRKVIPPGAGLGGGSSNAAAALVGVDQLFELNLGREKLLQLAQRLGSDVGFLVGAVAGGGASGSAIVTGLGERIVPAPLSQPVPLVLIFPPFGCPTADVYRAFDRLYPASQGRCEPDEQRVRQLASRLPVPPDAPFNDLAEPACVVRPELKRTLEQIRMALGIPVHITGSGSTLFVTAPDMPTANDLVRKITNATGLPAIATWTV